MNKPETIIIKSKSWGIPILCANQEAKDRILHKAMMMGVEIPEPIVAEFEGNTQDSKTISVGKCNICD